MQLSAINSDQLFPIPHLGRRGEEEGGEVDERSRRPEEEQEDEHHAEQKDSENERKSELNSQRSIPSHLNSKQRVLEGFIEQTQKPKKYSLWQVSRYPVEDVQNEDEDETAEGVDDKVEDKRHRPEQPLRTGCESLLQQNICLSIHHLQHRHQTLTHEPRQLTKWENLLCRSSTKKMTRAEVRIEKERTRNGPSSMFIAWNTKSVT